MTINRMVDSEGNVIRCRVRVQRGGDVVNKSFPTEAGARMFLLDFVRKYPGKQPSWKAKGIRVRDTVVRKKRQPKILYVEQPTIVINNCTLRRAPGRCEPMDECPHYLREGGCLDTTQKAGWEGWTVEGEKLE